jgi:hypothetical protein
LDRDRLREGWERIADFGGCLDRGRDATLVRIDLLEGSFQGCVTLALAFGGLSPHLLLGLDGCIQVDGGVVGGHPGTAYQKR